MSHNDFTSNELNQLFHWGLNVQQCCGLDSEDLALIEKIEKMIDSYCEHDFKQTRIKE